MEDKEIIALYFTRDAEASKYTYEKYGDKLKKQAERILNSKEDAEECVNDALLNAWNAIPPNNPIYFGAYLSQICRNLALNRLDKNKAKKRKAVIVELTKEMEACIPDNRTAEQIAQKELAKLLNDFLKGLSEEKRNIFLRRYWYADSYKEIAKWFGCSEGKIKIVLYRTRSELKKFLQKEGVEL